MTDDLEAAFAEAPANWEALLLGALFIGVCWLLSKVGLLK